MTSMGLGDKLGTDIPFEMKGFLPTSKFYEKLHKTKDWKPTFIISTAIGQGEILATPIQMANIAASIANRGYYYTPHLVKNIQDTVIDKRFQEKHFTDIDAIHYETIIEGMAKAVTAGTCHGINLSPEIEVCGKTGTSQNPHGKDHSIFMGFAPRENPKVAIYVLIETAGFGATWAVPTARLMIQKYLKEEIPVSDKWIEDRILNAQLSIIPSAK